MTIKVINSGVDTSFSTKLNGNLNASLKSSGLNLGRALIDRTVNFSADGGEWAEAYTDTNGRLNSVDEEESTAPFDTDKYTVGTSGNDTPVVDTNTYTLTSSGSATNGLGIKITAIYNSKLTVVTKVSGCSATRCNIELNGSAIARVNFSGDDATFDLNLIAGEEYTIRCDSSGASFDYRAELNATFPQVGTNVSWTGGAINDHAFNIQAVTTATGEPEASEITHDLPSETILKGLPTYTDATEYTYQGLTYNTIIDRTGLSVIITGIKYQATENASLNMSVKTTFTYSDVTTGVVEVSFSATGYTDKETLNPEPLKTVTGVKVEIKHDNDSNAVNKYKNHKEFASSYIKNPFSSTISSSFGTALVEDWEDGANVQYKLTNATEDTGWLDYNTVSEFTPFTSEPLKCIVKLIPKTTSPTAGFPSIKSFCVYE